MKKRCLLLLLVLAACAPAPVSEPVSEPEPVVEAPVIAAPVSPIAPVPVLRGNVDNYIIRDILPFSLVSAGAELDSFGFIPVERYDAKYAHDYTVVVHLFRFSSRPELDVVLNSEFYHVIDRGASSYRGNVLAFFLTQDDHRVVVWSSGTVLVYMEAFYPIFTAREVAEAYLKKYPSDMETFKCFDSDGNDHFNQGTASRVLFGFDYVEWIDVCLKDFAPYRNGQYVSRKGLNEKDGLLEGRCERDPGRPGFVDEYACPRGCQDGRCV
jgi:hypothetical protein